MPNKCSKAESRVVTSSKESVGWIQGEKKNSICETRALTFQVSCSHSKYTARVTQSSLKTSAVLI